MNEKLVSTTAITTNPIYRDLGILVPLHPTPLASIHMQLRNRFP